MVHNRCKITSSYELGIKLATVIDRKQAAHGLWSSAGSTYNSIFLRQVGDLYKTSNIGQSDLVFVRDQSSSVGQCVQDYK